MSEERPITILHLEDNPLDAELTCEMISGAGMDCHMFRIIHLEDFRRAMEEYPAKQNFDLILADYNMPGFDGFAALRITRAIDPDIPFILLSGALGEELAVELLRNGATDYVLKNNMQRLPLVVTRAFEEFQIRKREKQSQEEVREARDEAQKASSAKGRFLGRISHELRTPLNAIIGYTQLMQADPMSEEQQHCSERILKAGEHLLQLINEVLDITRIESGVIPMSARSTSIVPIIERAVDLTRPMARDAHVTIHIDGGPCNLFAYVDKDRLTQVLINLITNAVKYNKPNGHVYVECQEERSGFIKLLVRDTGIGIPSEKIERLFTPFDRLDLDVNSSIQGTGLGLTVVKSLVETMGGMVGVICSDNDGCIFWLEVPSATSAEPESVEDEIIPPLSSIPLLPLDCKILIIEDHAAAADFMERVFYRRGSTNLTVVKTMAEASLYIKDNSPDLIITEIDLPDGPGEDFILKLQGDTRLSAIPIIVLTIDASPEREKSVNDLNIFAYFTKPVKINPFVAAISRACAGNATDGL